MRASDGFSLIEVLAATVIMGVLVTAVLAPLTQLFERSSVSSRTLGSRRRALKVAISCVRPTSVPAALIAVA